MENNIQERRNIISKAFKLIDKILINYKSFDIYFNTLSDNEKIELYEMMNICFKYILQYAKNNYIKPILKDNYIAYIITFNDKNILFSLKNDKYNAKYIEKNFFIKTIIYDLFVENKEMYFAKNINNTINLIVDNIKILKMYGLNDNEVINLINNKLTSNNKQTRK